MSAALRMWERSKASISGFTSWAHHLGRQPVHEVGRVLVDARGEVVRARPTATPCRAAAAASRPACRPAPDRPPVENWTIMPGQCVSMPFLEPREPVRDPRTACRRRCAHGHGRWTRPPRTPRGWTSTCSATVIGTAGLSAFVGRLPVIATQMMQGVVMSRSGPRHAAAARAWLASCRRASTKKGRKPSGCSLIGKCPSSSITASVAPGIAAAVRRASSGVQVRS